MARKFFNQRVKGSNKSMLAYIIVGACILIIFVSVIMVVVFSNQTPEDAVIKIRDVVTVEINSELPDKTLFFAELQNVKESDIDVAFTGVDLTKVGEYPVEIDVFGESYESILTVVDTSAPELTVRNYAVAVGQGYNASNFVDTCSDNSGENCTIEFYEMAMDQNGNKIDYSSYTTEGVYNIQIVAKDSSGNVTSPLTAQLTIGNSDDIQQPTTCNYGNSQYDSNTYILGVNVTQNGCALDLNLYQNEEITKPAYDLADNDTEQMKKEINKLNISNVKMFHFNREISPVLNTTGTGVVGYTVHQRVTLEYNDGTTELVADYFINTNGGRVYSVNKYGIN